MTTLLPMTASGSVLILCITVVRALFLHRLPKAAFTALWLLAALRLLVPLWVPVAVPAARVPAPVTYTAPAEDTAALTEPAIPAPETEAVTAAEAARAPTFDFTVAALGGGAVCAGLFLFRHLRWRRRYREALPAENGMIDSIMSTYPCRRKVRVRVCQQVTTPLTYGLLRPVILLPKALEQADEATLTHILYHELTHVTRLHILYKYLLAAAACLHWFCPLAWLMYALAGRDLELSCDEAVLRRLGDGRRDYALTLIRLAQGRGRMPLVSGFAAGAVRERITTIMKYKKTSRKALIVCLALVLCACTAFVTAYAAPAKAPDGPVQYICETAYYTPEEFDAVLDDELANIRAMLAAGDITPAEANELEASLAEFRRNAANGVTGTKPMPVYYADGTPVVNSRGEQLYAKATDIADCNARLRYAYDHPAEVETTTADAVEIDGPAEPFSVSAASASGYDIHWYTYAECEDHVNQCRTDCEAMEGEWYFTPTNGWQEWTAQDTANTVRMLEQQLDALARGGAIGMDDDGDIMIVTSFPRYAGDVIETEAVSVAVSGDDVISQVYVGDAVSIEDGGQWDPDYLADYAAFGVTANSKKQWFEYNGRPIAGFVDDGRHLMTDSIAAEAGGIYVAVRRNARGVITAVDKITRAEFSRLSGMTA